MPSHDPSEGNTPGTPRPEPCPRNDDGSRRSRTHGMTSRVRVICTPGSVGALGGNPQSDPAALPGHPGADHGRSTSAGVRESGVAFMVPTYLFIVSLLAVLAIGVVKAIAGRRPARRRSWRRRTLPSAATAASLWILMRAFASGCTAMTGVEAVSNGVGAFQRTGGRPTPAGP